MRLRVSESRRAEVRAVLGELTGLHGSWAHRFGERSERAALQAEYAQLVVHTFLALQLQVRAAESRGVGND